jgi:tartrate/fumarate subfamily iron-sulfur-dependent hydro-lyase beta chain
MKTLHMPLSAEDIRDLHLGDSVLLSGVMITARDAAHKWMIDTYVRRTRTPAGDDEQVYAALKDLLRGGAIYHCGPVVAGLQTKQYAFKAAGPTTSIREEPYQGEVMHHFGVRAVIGKGGMGARTLAACREVPGVYLHAIGGAATLIAETVKRVQGVHKLEFGVPEAMWVIEVEDFPAVVTMDSHGQSLHAAIEKASHEALEKLLTT